LTQGSAELGRFLRAPLEIVRTDRREAGDLRLHARPGPAADGCRLGTSCLRRLPRRAPIRRRSKARSAAESPRRAPRPVDRARIPP
jgi:hypothetical protein